MPGAEGRGKGQQVQIDSYKMNQFLGCNEQYGNSSFTKKPHLKDLKRVNLNGLTTGQKTIIM